MSYRCAYVALLTFDSFHPNRTVVYWSNTFSVVTLKVPIKKIGITWSVFLLFKMLIISLRLVSGVAEDDNDSPEFSESSESLRPSCEAGSEALIVSGIKYRTGKQVDSETIPMTNGIIKLKSMVKEAIEGAMSSVNKYVE